MDTPPKSPCFKTSLLFFNKTPFCWRPASPEVSEGTGGEDSSFHHSMGATQPQPCPYSLGGYLHPSDGAGLLPPAALQHKPRGGGGRARGCFPAGPGGKRGSQAHVPTEPQEHKLLQRHRCICTFSQAPDISRNSAKNLTAVGAHLWGQVIDGEQGALQWRCAVPKLLNGAAISRPEPGPFPWLQMSLLVAPETGSARMGDARRSGAHTA